MAKAALNPPPSNVKRGGKYYQGKGAVIEYAAATCEEYAQQVAQCVASIQITSGCDGEKLTLSDALLRVVDQFRQTHKRGGRVFFVGNGGSAAIASHMAVDYTKNGGVRSLAFNDAATLTCLANDFGYDQVFAKQIEYQARKADAVVVISSSGRSLNIVGAADAARVKGCEFLVTLSGMNPNNILRQKGNLNFYVPCSEYGLVEISHLTLLHFMVGR